MIKINNDIISINKYPDGTMMLKYLSHNYDDSTITWLYENDEELAVLLFLSQHIKKYVNNVHLIMPYIPNARMDRAKNPEDVFTLKYFCEFINWLGFSSVTVLDPHSHVSEALIDNIIVESAEKYIKRAYIDVCKLNLGKKVMAYFPDEGAMKRYSFDTHWNYAFGIKRREWDTGKILGIDVAGATEEISGKPILIIDDISSRGGTFYHSAKKLKELGADKIYLYVTHCEGTIFDGEIFTSGLIDKIYTTNTIFNCKCKGRVDSLGLADKIEVFEYEKD